MMQLLLVSVFLLQAVGQLPNQTGIVTGRLTKNGQPVAGVRVSAMVIPEPGVSISEVSSLASVVLTDIDGRYRLESIPPGRYYITAGFLDGPTYYPGVSSINSARSISVEAGVTTTGIDFSTAVSAGVNVSGRVIFSPGQIAPVNLNASLAGPMRPAPTASVNTDGSFIIPRVRPGTYTLRVPPWSTTVIVGDVDIAGVHIEVPYNVGGSVAVENNGPLPRLSVGFTSVKSGAVTQNVTVSPGGAFSSQLTPGEYRVAVSGLPSGYTLKSVTAGGADILMESLKVGTAPAPLAITLAVSSPPPWVKVAGKVTGPAATASLSGEGIAAPIQVKLAADGSFEIPRVLPGDYTLAATSEVDRRVSFHVGNTDVHDIAIVVPNTKEVTARITMENQQQGIPVLSQLVTAATAGAGGYALSFIAGPVSSLKMNFKDSDGTTSTTATRQPDGTFRVKLPEGQRRITAEVEGFTVKAMSYGLDLLKDPVLTVTSSDTSQLEMTLSSSQSTLSSALISAQGQFGILQSFSLTISAAQNGVVHWITGGPTGAANTIVHIGPDIAEGNLLTTVAPAYPTDSAAIKESVVVRAEIDKEGNVTNVSIIQGHALLNEAAIAAVKQWRYRPHLVDGQPSAVVTTVRIPGFAQREKN
jgi:TonB family protein